MRSFQRSSDQAPGIGAVVLAALVGAGVGAALYHLLKPAFDGDETRTTGR